MKIIHVDCIFHRGGGMSLLDAITAGAQGIAFLYDSAETVIKCNGLRCAAVTL